MDNGFYNLEKDSIGKVSYIFKKKIEVSDKKKESLHLQNSSAYIEKLIRDLTFTPGTIVPANIYEISRKDTNKLIDQDYTFSDEIWVQIGQKESYEDILKIEASEDFVNWSDPYFIEEIKQKYIKENESIR